MPLLFYSVSEMCLVYNNFSTFFQVLTIIEAAHLLLFQNILYTPTEKPRRNISVNKTQIFGKYADLHPCWESALRAVL